MDMKKFSGASVLRSIAAVTLCASANATSIYDPTVVATPSINGSSVQLDGNIFADCCSQEPWTFEAFGSAGECLRFDLSAIVQPIDYEIVVVAPDGGVYQNNNRVGTDTRPLVKIGSAPNTGWYTVHVSYAAATQLAEGSFTIQYGRYPAGSINCTEGNGPTVRL